MYRYGRSSRQTAFRSDSPLSNEQILAHAPSVMAAEPHESRGSRYSYIPTYEVLDGLRAEGFQPFEVRQTKCRDLSKREYTKHMVRLRHDSASGNGAEVPEIILLNSHDGSSSYQLLAGIFRFVCSNGCIAGDICNDIRIRHSGNVISDVIEGSYTVLDNLKMVEDRIGQYKSIMLTESEQELFAETAAEIKWGRDDETNNLKAPIAYPMQILRPQRHQDVGNDLWRVFNRAQESLIKGGLTGRSESGRRTRTREVSGVSENVKLNRALWTMADRFAQLKMAA